MKNSTIILIFDILLILAMVLLVSSCKISSWYPAMGSVAGGASGAIAGPMGGAAGAGRRRGRGALGGRRGRRRGPVS